MNSLSSNLKEYIILGDFANAHLIIITIDNIELVKIEIQKLADVQENNVISFALHLANEGNKDLVRSIFPKDLRQFAAGDKFKIINYSYFGYDNPHHYYPRILGLQLDPGESGERQAWGMKDDGLDRMIWVRDLVPGSDQNNGGDQRIRNVQYGLYLKLASYGDSEGEHIAYGGLDIGSYDLEYRWTLKYGSNWNGIQYYRFENFMYGVELKAAQQEEIMNANTHEDLRIYGDPSGSTQYFDWKIVPV